MKQLLQINDHTLENCKASYGIAESLMNDYRLRVQNYYYRIIECEFYYSSGNHEDPFVHGHKRQKESIAEWYFHGSGLDITLSNGIGFGGILIRGIAKVNEGNEKPEKEDATIGPLNVCTKIFSQMGGVLCDQPIHFGLVDRSSDPTGTGKNRVRVFAVPRIGLNEDKGKEYREKPYRFISFLHLPHREGDKIKNYLLNVSEEKLTPEEYKEYKSGTRWF